MLPILGALAPIFSTVIDRVIPNAAEAEKVKLQIAADVQKAEVELAKAQMELAKEDAKSGKGGFRDWAGKLCIFSLGYAWIAHPLLSWVIALTGNNVVPPPSIDPSAQYAMLTGMLGLSGVRMMDLKNGTRK